MGKIQGSVLRNQTFTSTGRHLLVKFYSDSSVTNTGFAASYVLGMYTMYKMFSLAKHLIV